MESNGVLARDICFKFPRFKFESVAKFCTRLDEFVMKVFMHSAMNRHKNIRTQVKTQLELDEKKKTEYCVCVGSTVYACGRMYKIEGERGREWPHSLRSIEDKRLRRL